MAFVIGALQVAFLFNNNNTFFKKYCEAKYFYKE
jgi:hypothetical protein